MVKGRKVYDPVTNTWSTGYWIPVYDKLGNFVRFLPVWQDYYGRADYAERKY